MKNPFTAVLDEVAAFAELRATEARTGITLIQAVNADRSLVRIQAVTGSRELTQTAVDTALDLMAAGLTAQDVVEGLRFKWRMEALGITNEDLMKIGYEKASTNA